VFEASKPPALPSCAVVSDAPGDLPLRPINGPAAPVAGWLTTFHLVLVALDPFTSESAWLLPTVSRILRVYDDADCRVALLMTCDADEARSFLGPYAAEFLTFADPDRDAVKGLGLERLPALVHIRHDLSIAGSAEGWHPEEWRVVTDGLSRAMGWTRPVLPAPRDPAPFDGSPALGTHP
jgi:hypothetical protein